MFGALHLEQVTTLPFSDAGAMLQHASRLSGTRQSVKYEAVGSFPAGRCVAGFSTSLDHTVFDPSTKTVQERNSYKINVTIS